MPYSIGHSPNVGERHCGFYLLHFYRFLYYRKIDAAVTVFLPPIAKKGWSNPIDMASDAWCIRRQTAREKLCARKQGIVIGECTFLYHIFAVGE